MCEHDSLETPVVGILAIVDTLVSALVNLRIHHADHPRVAESVGRLGPLVDEYLATHREDSLPLGIADGFVILDGRPLAGLSLGAKRLVTALERCEAGGVELLTGLTPEESTALVELLGGRDPLPLDQANRTLAARRVTNARLLPTLTAHSGTAGRFLRPTSESGDAREAALPDGHVTIPLHTCQRLFDTLQETAVRISTGEAPDWDTARGDVEAMLHLLRTTPGDALNVARYEHYDAFTFGHSVRVATLAMHFAGHFIDDRATLIRIGVAGLLHDIGKVRLPYELLHFRGRLDEEQRREMQRHTELGAEILAASTEAEPLAVAAAFGHHRMGQKGYPRSVLEPLLSPVTRLVSICDIYEALTANRPYKAAMSTRAAFGILLDMPQVDRRLLREFIAVQGLFPTGTRVELDDGSIAVVDAQTDRIDQPLVTTVVGREGSPLAPHDSERIDLRHSPVRIVGEGSERIQEPQTAVR